MRPILGPATNLVSECLALLLTLAGAGSAFAQLVPGNSPVIIQRESFEGAVEVAEDVIVQPATGLQPTASVPVETKTEQPASNETGNDSGETKQTNDKSKAESTTSGGDTATVKRPATPPKIADPRELKAAPDKSGKVSFSFNGQMWPDVLQWLAGISGYSLDWTELPGGYLNLTTQRPYTLPEARDLINRQLHARGYTLILSGEVLSVFKIDKLDPSLIPRVTEEQLYDLQPHDFIKITFQLPEEMEIAAAAEDVKKIASEHAKVIPLPATRRLLMISTVANARLVSVLLNEERLAAEGQVVPVEIVLKHRRAEKIIDILYVILGLDPSARPSQEELAVQQQKMQLLMQMQGAGKDVSQMMQANGPPVYLAYNSHRNSVIVNAPADALKKIRRTIEMLDVPANGGLSDVAARTAPRTPKSYKLETIDPRTLLTTLEEIGDLSPLSELRADSRANILFARATETDHQKIANLIEQLDEAGMETMVVQLRKHPADAVAGTLRTMFAPEKKEKNNGYDTYRYDWHGGLNYNQQNEELSANVRIDADIETNRLIIRGTSEQLTDIRDFLIKIGESLDDPPQDQRVRMVDAMSPQDTAKLLQQLREIWPTIGENELVIEDAQDTVEPTESLKESPQSEPNRDREARTHQQDANRFLFAVEKASTAMAATARAGGDSAGGDATQAAKPRVIVRVRPDGRLMLSSDDVDALNRLESLIESAAPSQQRFRIFQVRYVTAYSIYLTLKNLYKEELNGKQTEGYFVTIFSDFNFSKSTSSDAQLSQRKLLQLDWDTGSNTILVANASASQLHEIELLIEAYDQPSGKDDSKTRRTAAIKLKYSRANVVAAALKEVYRDLLSSRDKEFETEDKKGAVAAREATTIILYGQDDSEDGKKPTPVKVGFQGALSVGVDEISNTIVISVQEELFESVLKIIESLDEAARPQTTVAVHSLDSSIAPEALQKALSDALGTPWVGGKPEIQQPGNDDGQGSEGGQREGQPTVVAPIESSPQPSQ